jgi:hypothetical protein
LIAFFELARTYAKTTPPIASHALARPSIGLIRPSAQLMPTQQFTHYYMGGQERLKRDGHDAIP